MAKAQQQQATTQAGNLATSSTAQRNAALSGGPGGAFGSGGLTGAFTQAQDTAKGFGQGAASGFTQAQTTGGYDPAMLQTIRGNAANLAATGGYDPTTLANMRGQYQNFTQTGGYDPAALKTYQDFATTGGFTPQQQSQYMAQATGGVKNTYDTLMAQEQAKRAATGGLGGDATSQMARQLSQAQAGATIGGETSLQQQISANKLAGAGGLGQIAAAKQAALTGETGLETGVAGGIRSGVGEQADIEKSVAGGSLAGSQGLAQLFNTQTGAVSDTGKMILDMMGIDSSNQQASITALTNLSKNPGAFDDILRIASIGADAVP